MEKHTFTLNIPARSKAEATQKARAFAGLAKSLDGDTLEALMRHVPAILADPVESEFVKSRLGLL